MSDDNVSDDNVNNASANYAVPLDMDRGGLDAVLGFHLSDSQWEAVSAPLAPGERLRRRRERGARRGRRLAKLDLTPS